MGLFRSLLGIDKHEGALNSVLANHLFATCDDAQKRRIVQCIASIQVAMRNGRITTYTAIEELNTTSRIVQTNFIALACNNLALSPNIPGYSFHQVENPYRAGSTITEDHIEAAYESVRRTFALLTPWPGTSRSIDLLKLL